MMLVFCVLLSEMNQISGCFFLDLRVETLILKMTEAKTPENSVA
jgi:hypothetical protein